MISWNLLLSGKTLSDQAYAVLNKLVGQTCSGLNNSADATTGNDQPVVHAEQ
ncbi:MAG: hypothetical protein AB1403_14225 [Candidatus Riflebacteria bacterium]